MSSIVPSNPKPNNFKNYARAVLARRLDGERLRFDKGAYLAGEFGVLDSGTQLVALMSTLRIGWIKWFQGEVVGHALGYVDDGFVPPRREELDDRDPATWERDARTGEPADPWRETNELVMVSPETSKIYTFTTGARGGFSATAELCAGYDPELPYYPLVELGSSSYQHRNKAFGRIQVPVFHWLKNVDADRYDAILSASRGGAAPAPAIEKPKPDGNGDGAGVRPFSPLGGPIDDDIPFMWRD